MSLIRFTTSLTLLIIVLIGQAQSHEKNCLKITNDWMGKTIHLVKNTPGYSAPVAARTLCYVSVANYESTVSLVGGRTLSGQLSNLDLSHLQIPKSISYEHVSNTTQYLLAQFFFENMSPSDQTALEEFYKEEIGTYKKNYSKKTLKASYAYAEELVEVIINWSKEDGADNAWNRNFPKTFKPEECDGCWEETLPGYVSALQPYWGENRLMLTQNKPVCDDIPFLPYATDTASEFYKEANMIFTEYKDLTKEQIDIAKFWNDAAGVSGTPAGHLFSIALSLSQDEELDLKKTAQLYAMLGIAVNDAVRESWRLKYKYNLIRPITYIHRNISEKFTPALITPPFPEFPSGHSFQSGSATEVFNHFFGMSYHFVDHTNEGRPDINGAARSYDSFNEMGEEMSLSRYFGGIHFLNTLNVSMAYGRKIGKNTVATIKFDL